MNTSFKLKQISALMVDMDILTHQVLVPYVEARNLSSLYLQMP